MVDLEEKFADRNTIWSNLDAFRRQQNEWFVNDLRDLDVEEIEKYMKVYFILFYLFTKFQLDL